MSNKLRFGLPKGSLQEATIQKMAKAGYNISVSSRSYIPHVDDPELEIRLIRAQEISRYVDHGYLDCGITGHDWVIENGSKVHEVGEFLSARRRHWRAGCCACRNIPRSTVKDLRANVSSDGSRQSHQKIFAGNKALRGGGIFLGRDRSEGARISGCDCRGHRDRILAPCE